MEFPALRGRSILVVEDELLIGMDIRSSLEEAGAHVTSTTTVRHALMLAEDDGLAGAIMDHALKKGRRQHGAMCAIDCTGHSVRQL